MHIHIQPLDDTPVIIFSYVGNITEPIGAEEMQAVHHAIAMAEQPICPVIDIRDLDGANEDVAAFMQHTWYSMMNYNDLAQALYAMPPVFISQKAFYNHYIAVYGTAANLHKSQPLFMSLAEALDYISNYLTKSRSHIA